MRIAIFSDIHGNDVALSAMLAALERDSPDQLICLGDVVVSGPQSQTAFHLDLLRTAVAHSTMPHQETYMQDWLHKS